MTITQEIENAIKATGRPERVALYQRFFQTAPGQYGEGDTFIASRVPDLRKIAKTYAKQVTLREINHLLQSPIHEMRFVALAILVDHYKRGDAEYQNSILSYYLSNTERVNNWDLVDTSAHHIVGDYTLNTPFPLLTDLAHSSLLWDRRIAIVATLAHIRTKNPAPTLVLAESLLRDSHDLIHKATGWMLREMGKTCGTASLTGFLDENATIMPRTMLRYAIEKLPRRERLHYLSLYKQAQ